MKTITYGFYYYSRIFVLYLQVRMSCFPVELDRTTCLFLQTPTMEALHPN